MYRACLVILCLTALSLAPAGLPAAHRNLQGPGDASTVRRAQLDRLDAVVGDAIRGGQLPGAVIAVGHRDGVVFERAYGNRAVEPEVEPMTVDTVFDLASLTKVVATTTSVMMLVEEGRLRLDDAVARYLPDFGRFGKSRVSLRHLLTHTSGLRPGLELEAEFEGRAEALDRVTHELLEAPPGERFVYSDINFILLGEIVAAVSGAPLDRFARERIFQPLGMRDTSFTPPSSLAPRIAPTEPCLPLAWPCQTPGAPMLRGAVHDPTARRMGGVAGHAGLFSTAADLAIFCRMILGGGALGATRVLSQASVARMTAPATPPGLADVRGLGWDIDSRYSANRGDLFPIGSFGHTGFTGTSLWIDPLGDAFVVFLSNRVHPDGKGDVTGLRARVATVAASALGSRSPAAGGVTRWTGADRVAPAPARAGAANVLAGLDVLRRDGFAPLKGRRVGLLTHRAGRARSGESAVDVLRSAEGVTLAALFSPEHGLASQVDERVASARDETTGLPVHSLYGDTLRPTSEMLDGLDVIVVDLQDVGTRFYTYATSMAYMMEAAAARGLPVVVLDRPNPINGVAIEGPPLDDAAVGFTGYLSMPIRHGLTMGELARLFNGERGLKADLTVVPLDGWRRDRWFDATGLAWTNPSPNIRNLLQATLYPGIGAIEGANLSVGRGTDTPFEQIGAPWVDGVRLAEALNGRGLPGVRFYPVTFTPDEGAKFGGERCSGVFLIVTDRDALRPVRLGLEVAAALLRLHGEQFEIDRIARLLGSVDAVGRLKAGDEPEAIARSWASAEAEWRKRRAPYLLYVE